MASRISTYVVPVLSVKRPGRSQEDEENLSRAYRYHKIKVCQAKCDLCTATRLQALAAAAAATPLKKLDQSTASTSCV
jgi:hypothetical protein